MLRNVQKQHAAEAASGGCKARCQGIERSITVYTASITGHEATIKRHEAELASMGGKKVARPKAAAFATAAAIFGADRARVEAAAIILEPFAYSLLLELTAIVAFGYAFGHRRQPVSATVAEPTATARGSRATVPATVADKPEPTPPKTGNRRLVAVRSVATRAAAEADVVQLIGRGQPLPSQDVLAMRWNVHKGTASKWLADFEARGIISRRIEGRCKIVAAA